MKNAIGINEAHYWMAACMMVAAEALDKGDRDLWSFAVNWAWEWHTWAPGE